MNADFVAARKLLSVKETNALKQCIWKPGERERLDSFVQILKSKPAFDKRNLVDISRPETLHVTFNATYEALKLRDELSLSPTEFMELMSLFVNDFSVALHEKAFVPVIESQGSDEQIAKWKPLYSTYQMIGCYGQTEIAHGSNVQRLEATATYDKKTQEFIMNSPREESYKFWIGNLGVTANTCLIQAQLYIDGKNYGPHLFVTPIRDMKTHNVLPGVIVGDIGAKVLGAYSTVDNGFLGVKNVRIPRENMLNRFSNVTPDGNYVPPVHPKLSYGSMLTLRANIVAGFGKSLAKAATIASRYTTVRRQFAAPTDRLTGVERQVITYPGVAERIAPAVATAYAFCVIGNQMADEFRIFSDELLQKNTKRLPDLHIKSSFLKVLTTTECAMMVEDCRKALGGHGMLQQNGVGTILGSIIPSQTYEGENYVIAQQTARDILRYARRVYNDGGLLNVPDKYGYFRSARKTSNEYGTGDPAEVKEYLSNPRILIRLLESRVRNNAFKLLDKIKHDPAAQGAEPDLARYSMDTMILTRAHAEWHVGREMFRKAQTVLELNLPLQVYLLFVLNRSLAELLEQGGGLAPAGASIIRELFSEAVARFSPKLIAYTDAFGFTDYELNSSLGRYDGNVYANLLDTAKNHNAVNKEDYKKDVLRLRAAFASKSRL
ncbi:hypothetical protein CANCADRAFT_30130 [Tortispora caseinolytica NRRL Y-17796]|uniref:Acyl-coenzyme A oxidase n=1 Tax=Tortispora caseinolytica NRRL Y-17796 TaxID=767744 RepID=A0A1E4TJ51_9ASCO|nr:hypothetical protein CANCADRAFT_30130 [Tortispora caseinolytica NRRL Y-17796]